MKKILTIIIATSCLLSSCSDILNRQIPEHNTVDGNVITDQASAETALVGVYSYLAASQWEFYYMEVFSNLAGTLWCTYRAGQNSSTEGVGYDYELIDNKIDYSTSTVKDQWQGAYDMILAANWLILLTEKVEDDNFTGDSKNEILAEARFLRFFAHFYLFRLHCRFWDLEAPDGLLYREKPVSISNQLAPRLTVAQSYDKLLEDLEFAIKYAPAFSSSFEASKEAAKAFKAELLMMRGNSEDMQTIIDIVDEIAPKFAMEADIDKLYANGAKSSEVIFARFQSTTDAWGTPVMKTFSYNTNYRLTDMMGDIIDPASKYNKLYRGETIVYDPQGNEVKYQNTLVKMAPTGKTDADIKATTKVFYMRAAQLHLLKAEAIARRSGDAEAVKAIINEQIYARSGHPLVTSASGEQAILDQVYDALLLELSIENGADFTAAVRFTNAAGVPKIIDQKRYLQDINDMWRVISPIPQEELRVNSLMKQNYGYPVK